MLIDGTLVTIPSPRADIPARTLYLERIQVAEARHGEVAIVTPVKAPELLVLFNTAWGDCDKYYKQLSYVITVATAELGKRRSTILLYEADPFLKAQGITSTKDTRDAVILLDAEYQRLQETVDQLTAVSEYMKGKLKFFENAFSSVKKIMGEDAYNMSTRVNNPRLSHGAEPPRPQTTPVPAPGRLAVDIQTTPTTTPPKASGYGKARYDRR